MLRQMDLVLIAKLKKKQKLSWLQSSSLAGVITFLTGLERDMLQFLAHLIRNTWR